MSDNFLDNLLNKLRLLQNCPNCNFSFSSTGIDVVDKTEQALTVQLMCDNCSQPTITTVFINKVEAGSAVKNIKNTQPLKITSELSEIEEKSFSKKNSITNQEILELYKHIK